MRRKNTESLSDVVRQILKEQNLDGKLSEKHLIEAWPLVLGQNISQYTTDLSIKNQTLHVSISSAVLRHDLFLSRAEIVRALNRHVGKEVIKGIVFR